MELHRASGRRLGLGLAVTTMLLWAVLPFALQGVLVALDPFTITWARFAVSALLLLGLGCFFGSRLDVAAAGLPAGAGLIALAALSWAIYGLAQKQLLRRLSSAHVLLCVYVGCAIVFTPFAALNTLVATAHSQSHSRTGHGIARRRGTARVGTPRKPFRAGGPGAKRREA